MNTDEDIWSRVITLHARVEHELSRAMQRRHGLGLSEYRALSRLAETEKGVMRMQELADAVGLNQSSVSRLVARLEGDGLSERDLCPDDRRGVYTMITEEGHAQLAAARPTYSETLSAALDQAATDPALAIVIKALRC